VSNIGITGSYGQSFGASSELESGGQSYSTTMREWSAGARLRIPFSSHQAGVGLRYGAQSFTVDGDSDPGATTPGGSPITRDYIPDISYKYVRPSADIRLGFGPVTVGASLGVRFVLNTGALESSAWFPASSAFAGDAEVYGGYTIVKDLFVVLGFAVQRYGIDMHSSPADLPQGRDVAGGAVDQYLILHTGIEWRPGSGGRPSGTAGKPVHVGSR
jgi:hypothetical protein